MKTKLQALIAEQKALTTKFEELMNEDVDVTHKKVYCRGVKGRGEDVIKSLLDYGAIRSDIEYSGEDPDGIYYILPNNTISALFDNIDSMEKESYLIGMGYSKINISTNNSAKPNNPDPKKVYIKGHPTRGAEVIKMLEDLGGVNEMDWNGDDVDIYYGIRKNGHIESFYSLILLSGYTELHLPEEVNEVDSQKEEVELIEGEVYAIEDFYVLFNGFTDNYDGIKTLCSYNHIDDEFCDTPEIFTNDRYLHRAHPKQHKQLFDTLEKVGKHFDKENMRLLDVEEWSKEHRDYPVICRSDNNSSWSVKLMCEYVKGRALVKTRSSQNQWMSQAIPYNDQTKLLIGTTDNPDKHYVFVESRQNDTRK